MADFAGGLSQTIGPGGPFPDPLAGLPKPPAASVGGGAGIPYPAGPFDPVNAVPGLVPFERVGSGGLKAFGVDPQDLGNQGDGQSGRGAAGFVQLVGADFPSSDHAGSLARGIGFDWFDRWIVAPGRLDLGNVLTTQVRTLEVLNNFRRQARTWQGFTNNAGSGVTATNLPALPTVLQAFESFVVDIQISTNGPPNINGTLEFDIDQTPPDTIDVLVTGNRITIFPYHPQAPVRETLEFLSDIIPHDDGSEQRSSLREAPRQLFSFTIRTDNDRTRDSINAVITDWQSRVFGIPLWHEQRPLLGDVAINATTILVDTTFSDYRVGGLVMLYASDFVNETLEITAVNPGDVEVQSGPVQAFVAQDTVVMPTRTAYTRPSLDQSRAAIGPTDFSLLFETLDNIDLSDASAFPTFMGVGQTVAKPVIDRLNFINGNRIAEGYRRDIAIIDHETGPPLQFSPWSKSKPTYEYGFESDSRQAMWELRQLAHFVRGSQISFYVGTGRSDFKPNLDISDTSTSFDMPNIGFTQFYQQVTPRSDLRVTRTDGTTSLHTIIGSSVVSNAIERIDFSPGISPALPLAELEKVEFLTLSRIADDKVLFVHDRPDQSRVSIKLLGVPA